MAPGPRYLIFFETIASGIAFLISLSVCSLLAYRKTINFCMLTFVSTVLPKVFIRCKHFFFFWLPVYVLLSVRSYHLQTGII
jgi:hypothetical protein